MTHTIIYLGNLDKNLARLREHGRVRAFKRIDADGNERDIDARADKADGIVFGYMEEGGKGIAEAERFFAVAVERIVLDKPVRLIPDRHTDGKKFGPSASQFGDSSARALLGDIIRDNPGQTTELRATWRADFGEW